MLLAISRMAGMECPGDRSVLHRCDLARDDAVEPASVAGALRFRVEHFDARFSSARMRVAGAGCSGTVDAFLAPLPVVQPSTAELLASAACGQFSGVRALVVGGSRGLGEATAKLLAAGGADVVITYHVGELDAASVCRDISAAGGRAQAVAFDVLDDRNDAAPVLPAGWAPSHLFYFATPRIALAEAAGFSPARFRRYTAFYVEGFVRLIEGRLANGGGELTAFYPSTTALDEILPKALEYASAKAAGEAACRHLAARHPRLRVQVSRLPRTRTDTTATVVPVEDQEATAVMRDELRRLMTRSAPRAEGTPSPR
jgi:NAD(P)-dependent dehydrogenase (short-subunit alcohol dehydrogenase family)